MQLIAVDSAKRCTLMGAVPKGLLPQEALFRVAKACAKQGRALVTDIAEQTVAALPLDDAGTVLSVITKTQLQPDQRRALIKQLHLARRSFELVGIKAAPTESLAETPAANHALEVCEALYQSVLQAESAEQAAALLASELANRWQLPQVALLREEIQVRPEAPKAPGRVRLQGLSQSAKIDHKSLACRALEQQIEAADSDKLNCDGQGLLRTKHGWAIAAPECRGARWWLLVPEGELPKPTQIYQWQSAWSLFAGMLEAKTGASGPIAKLKLAVRQKRFQIGAALALLAILLVPVDYRIGAVARLEGGIERVLVAPDDGIVGASHARAGDRVEAGQVIAQLTDDSLRLEQQRLANELAQLEGEYRQALVEDGLSAAQVLKTRVAQAQAELDLANYRLSQYQITAPFAGVIIQGDLTGVEGAGVTKGQVLFELAPVGEFRLVLLVEEHNIGALAAGQKGSLYLNASPGQAVEIAVLSINGVIAEQDQKVRYRVEAELLGEPPGLSLQPGMEGIAKVSVATRPLGWILLHRPWQWLMLKWWAISP